MAEPVTVVVGTIGRAHGVRGEVMVRLRTDEPERRFAAGSVLLAEGGAGRFTVQSSRDHSGRFLVRFAELTDRTAAEAARGTVLLAEVAGSELPAGDGEFYDRQLVGLRVLVSSGGQVGAVTGVLHLPAQDLLEVDASGVTRLVPFVTALVPAVDLTAGTLTVTDLAGLLDDGPGDGADPADRPADSVESADESAGQA